MNRDHPVVEQVERTGYPAGMEGYFGTDFFGNEIYAGEEIVLDHHNGEMVRAEDLEKYVQEMYGLQFITAE